jgi:hypothetical protein
MAQVTRTRCKFCPTERNGLFIGNICRPCHRKRAAAKARELYAQRATGGKMLRPRVYARRGDADAPAAMPFLLAMPPRYQGPPCVMCDTPTGPGGFCVGCGVVNRGAA